MTSRIHLTWARSGWLCLGLAFGLAILGCSKSKDESGGSAPVPGPQTGMPGPGGGPPPDEVFAKLPGGDEFAAAKRLYANNTCANCHKLGDTGGRRGGLGGGEPGGKKGGPGGPDLTTVGAKADRTKEWLADHIRNPKAHRAQSRMPSFGPDKISDADLARLADYLASRK